MVPAKGVQPNPAGKQNSRQSSAPKPAAQPEQTKTKKPETLQRPKADQKRTPPSNRGSTAPPKNQPSLTPASSPSNSQADDELDLNDFSDLDDEHRNSQLSEGFGEDDFASEDDWGNDLHHESGDDYDEEFGGYDPYSNRTSGSMRPAATNSSDPAPSGRQNLLKAKAAKQAAGKQNSAVKHQTADRPGSDRTKKFWSVAIAGAACVVLTGIGTGLWLLLRGERSGADVEAAVAGADAGNAAKNPVDVQANVVVAAPMKGDFVAVTSSRVPPGPHSTLRQLWAGVGPPEALLTKAGPNEAPKRDDSSDGVPVPFGDAQFVSPKADLTIGPFNMRSLITPNRSHAVAMINGENASAYDLATGEVVASFNKDVIYNRFSRVTFDGRKCLGLLDEAGVGVWDSIAREPSTGFAKDRQFEWIEIIDDSHVVLLCKSPQVAVEVWNFNEQTMAGNIAVGTFDKRPQDISYRDRLFALSPDLRYAAIVQMEAVEVVDLREFKLLGSFPIPGGSEWEVTAVGFLPLSRQLAVTTAHRQATCLLRTWDTETGRLKNDLTIMDSTARLNDDVLKISERGVPGEIILSDDRSAVAIDSHGTVMPLMGLDYAQLNPATPEVSLFDLRVPPTSRSLELPDNVSSRLQGDPNATQGWLLSQSVPADKVERLKPDKTVPVQPPQDWITPPFTDWTGPAENFEAVLYWPDVITRQMSVSFEVVPFELPNGQGYEVKALRYDRATGEYLPPLQITPNITPPGFAPIFVSYGTLPHAFQTAAVSPNGDLAWVGPVDRRTVLIFDRDGQRSTHSMAASVRWMNYAADGNLIVESDGVVTSWNLQTKTAAWSVQGDYQGPADMVADGQWAVFHAASHIDVLEASTGKCLGQLPALAESSASRKLLLSPDGSRLLVSHYNDDPVRGRVVTDVIWDLKTRDRLTFQNRQTDHNETAGWIAPTVIARCGYGVYLMDLLANEGQGTALGMLRPEAESNQKYVVSNSTSVRVTPDGQLAVQAFPDPGSGIADLTKSVWCRIDSSDFAVLNDPQRKHYSLLSQPVRVEVDCSDSGFGSIIGSTVADSLASAGCRLGNGGWILRIRHEIIESPAPGAGPDGANLHARITIQVIDSKTNQLCWNAAYLSTATRIDKGVYRFADRQTEPPMLNGEEHPLLNTQDVPSGIDHPGPVFLALVLEDLSRQGQWIKRIPGHFVSHGALQSMAPPASKLVIRWPK